MSGLADNGAARRTPFEHLSRSKVRGVLNHLTESTFFYRSDDADLFEYLRRQRAEFARFFEDHFGWELYVDRKCARLFKTKQHNRALTRKQRHLFDLTRRDECLLFMLLLEFHEHELARLNAHYEHDEDLLFELADFVAHAIERYGAELGERAPTDRELFASIQSLFRELERHRFIDEVERQDLSEDEALAAGQTARVLYAFLPGLRCYDPERLNESLFSQAFGTGDGATEVDPPEGPEPEGPEPEQHAPARGSEASEGNGG